MRQNNVKVAVTGGIGSGKSAVCSILVEEGYAVISCDEVYSELLKERQFIEKLAEEFGADIIDPDGSLNRAALSQKAFGDKSVLERLNSITHPAIMQRAFEKAEGEAIAFFEVPLLFESRLERLFNEVFVVLRNFEERIKAVCERSGISRGEVEKRIESQYSYENSDFAKYYVIHNSSNLDYLKCEVLKAVQKIKEKYC